MRGNLLAQVSSYAFTGSIPAYAGEPDLPPEPGAASTVYPRVCGGTHRMPCAALVFPGLSPRMRGNPQR